MESRNLQDQHLMFRVNGKTLRNIYRAILFASLIGLFASFYLLITYISGKPIVCGSNAGCEIVRASKWAYTFGIPRPALGVVFYLTIIIFLTLRAYAPTWRPRFWKRLLLIVATIGLVESGFLTLIQWFDIKAFCLWCIISAAASVVLFFLSVLLQRSARDAYIANAEADLKELKYIFQSFIVVACMGSVAVWFLLRSA